MISRLKSIYSRLTSGGSPESQAIQSGIWVTGINVLDRVFQLIKLIVLTRLLSPSAFGLLGIALLTLAALKQFSRLGFDQALIQHREENVDRYLNTAWVIKLARGAVLGVVAFASAPYIAEFFGEPVAKEIIQVLAVSPILLGLQNPAVVYFEKNLNFHKEFLYKIGGRTADVIAAISFALVYKSVWALVAGFLTSRTVMLIISYLIHPYRPNFEMEIDFAREMFTFGKWIFISGILTFLYGQGDDAFVGWFFTATTLGFYQIAYQFSNAPATEVTHIISRVAFPAFSKVQENKARLREGFFRAVQLSTVIAFPMAAGILVVAPQFVKSIFGSEWTPMIPIIQILSLWGAQRALGATVGPVFKAVGRPDISTKLQSLKVLIIAVLIYPAADQYGILGVGYVLVGNTFVTLPVSMYLVLSIIKGRSLRLAKLVLIPLIGSGIMAALVFGLDVHLIQSTGTIQLFVLIVVGAMFYVGIMVIVERISNYEFIDLIKYIYRTI